MVVTQEVRHIIVLLLQGMHVCVLKMLTWDIGLFRPTPDISWLKDGKPIVYGTDSFEQGVRSLKIEKVDKKTHEGQYECKATSSASPAPITSSARLDVQGTKSFKTSTD